MFSPMNPSPRLRGVFSREEDPDYEEALSQFPNHVPRFYSKVDALKFTEKFASRRSNPDELHLLHSISTLTTWDQIEKYVLPKMRELDMTLPKNPVNSDAVCENRFLSATERKELVQLGGAAQVHEYLCSRLDLPIHRYMAPVSTINTLKYLFYHMRCGIYVMIRNNDVVMFCPFVNSGYRNSWGEKYPIIESSDGTLETYYAAKRQSGYREEDIIPKSHWWANGNIIDNEHSKSGQWLGDHFLLQLKDMVVETCRNRYVPDCDLFLNKRDYPHLKFNEEMAAPVEPYGFIFDRDDRNPSEDMPLNRHLYSSCAPIL